MSERYQKFIWFLTRPLFQGSCVLKRVVPQNPRENRIKHRYLVNYPFISSHHSFCLIIENFVNYKSELRNIKNSIENPRNVGILKKSIQVT